MTSPSRSSTGLKRALLQLVCALLLVAQHVGLAHAVWHAAQHVPVHRQGPHAKAPQPADAPAQSDASKLCPLDAAYGQVLGAGPLACVQFHPHSLAAHAPSHAAGTFATLDIPTPRSRGPPSRL
jgi:hypothetical protein